MVNALERIEAAAQQLFRLRESPDASAPWVPAWSSYVLEQTVAAIIRSPDGSVSDLMQAAWLLLERTEVVLNRTVANFVNDIAGLVFALHRREYADTNFDWMLDQLASGATPAQAYLAAYVLPEAWHGKARSAILDAISCHPMRAEIEALIAPDEPSDTRR
jgi:hypothetical protein